MQSTQPALGCEDVVEHENWKNFIAPQNAQQTTQNRGTKHRTLCNAPNPLLDPKMLLKMKLEI